LARAVNTHLRTVRDDANLEEMISSEREVLQRAAEVERRMLADLQAILQPEQVGEFESFLCAHRRTLLKVSAGLPLPFDLREFLVGRGLDRASSPEVFELLSRFEIEQDAAIVRDRLAVLGYFASVRAGFDGTPESKERDRAAQAEMFASRAELQRVQARALLKLVGSLEDEMNDAFVLEVIARTTESYDPTLAVPELYPVVREVLALDLTGSQREQIKTLIDQSTRELLGLARTRVVQQAEYVLKDAAARNSVPTAPNNVFLGEAVELRRRVSKQVLDALTPQQRNLYDASPVLNPSDSSRVDDEP
jgi:hypothetical protein